MPEFPHPQYLTSGAVAIWLAFNMRRPLCVFVYPKSKTMAWKHGIISLLWRNSYRVGARTNPNLNQKGPLLRETIKLLNRTALKNGSVLKDLQRPGIYTGTWKEQAQKELSIKGKKEDTCFKGFHETPVLIFGFILQLIFLNCKINLFSISFKLLLWLTEKPDLRNSGLLRLFFKLIGLVLGLE